jgi:hypothetical protein
MFSKLKLKQAGRVDQQPNLQLTNYHATNLQLSISSPKWDIFSKEKVEVVIKSQDTFIKLNPNKVENIENQVHKYIKIKKDVSINHLLLQDVLNQSLITFKKALEHDCYHDIIARNEIENTVTVAFLPITTSNNIVPCGIQKFNTIHVNINLRGYKTMPVDEYNQWVIDSQKWYQDTKLRTAIFNEIQKDLDANHYSLLKDSDLIEPNEEFLSKELPLVKFKFTELEL